jgi:hypothetical protein
MVKYSGIGELKSDIPFFYFVMFLHFSEFSFFPTEYILSTL